MAEKQAVFVATTNEDTFDRWMEVRRPQATKTALGTTYEDDDHKYIMVRSPDMLRNIDSPAVQLGIGWNRLPGSRELLDMAKGRYVRPTPPPAPERILVITPRIDFFEAYMDEVHNTRSTERSRAHRGSINVGPTEYRHVPDMRRAQGYDRQTPYVLARGWERIQDVDAFLARFSVEIKEREQ